MADKITEKEIIAAISQQTGISKNLTKKIFESAFEEIFQNVDRCQSVTVKNFGTFYIKPTQPTRTFKFNPSQRLRRSLGWSVK